MNYKEQNNELIKNFLNRTFFKSWKEINPNLNSEKSQFFYGNYGSLELDFTDCCSSYCAYCYVKQHGKEYFPNNELKNPKIIYENSKILFKWLSENKFTPKIEMFGGDVLVQNVTYDIIPLILDYSAKGTPIARSIVIPTNMDFLFNDKKTRLIEEYIKISQEVNTPIFLSASIDGKLMEENRPIKDKRCIRDDHYYDRLFKFAQKYRIGFHPMVYSQNIEKWKDNFLWFQEMFQKYNLPPNNMYLLEVRNKEWNEEECKELYNFMKFLIKWVFDVIKNKENPIRQFFQNHWSFNILSSLFSNVGRGLGCSLQSAIYLRLGDLTAFPCHRLFYDHFKLFSFVKENNKIIDIEAHNPELYICTNSLESKNQPMCEQCLINEMCSHNCLGSSYEGMGDVFIPQPSVCRMEFYKILGILDGLKDINYLDNILNVITKEKKNAILRFLMSRGIK